MGGIQLHPRTMPVAKAQRELESLIFDFAEKNGLTEIETLQAVTSYIQTTLKYALRAERHPEEPDKKADEA